MNTAIQDAIRARSERRPSEVFSLMGPLGIDAQVRIRKLNVGELADASRAAYEFQRATVVSLPAAYVARMLDDPAVIEDARCIEVLWRSFRDADDVSAPAFPSTQWIRENMTLDECRHLFGFYRLADMSDPVPAEVIEALIERAAAGDLETVRDLPVDVLIQLTAEATRRLREAHSAAA